jgi:hypothetical protein
MLIFAFAQGFPQGLLGDGVVACFIWPGEATGLTSLRAEEATPAEGEAGVNED